MTTLVNRTPEARAWVNQVKQAHAGDATFGKLVSSAIWSNATGPDGKLLVAADPSSIVADINTNGMMMLNGHDPGAPVGKVLAASIFTAPDGETFVAAVQGYFAGGKHLSFREMGLDVAARAPTSSRVLPAVGNDCWISVGFDAREVEPEWIDDAMQGAPLRVELAPRSNNAVDVAHVLISVGLLFVFLVFKPFATAVASEAGKDTYIEMRSWLRKFLGKLSEQKDPIVQIAAHHHECQISFIFRGEDVKRHYAAHEALSDAAMHAKYLVENMKRSGYAARQIVYEFDPNDDLWFPSFAELHDGRFVTDKYTLIAVEQLPSQVSLSIGVGDDKPLFPSER